MGVASAIDEAYDRAHDGAPQGSAVMAPDGTGVAVVLRPSVPMGFLTGLAHVCAIAVCEVLVERGVGGVGILWPHDAAGADGGVARVSARAGYGEGVFAVCGIDLSGLPAAGGLGEGLLADLAAHVERLSDSWAAALSGGRAEGPLAPVLGRYFDLSILMGREVELAHPNGRAMSRGSFVGVDVWGRATLRTAAGDLEVSPGQCVMRPVLGP